jgi:hypothetical protein
MNRLLSFLDRLEQIDRRVIYAFVLFSLAIPILLGVSLKPARMQTATDFFSVVEKLQPEPNQVALLSFDWGPGTSAENSPQSELILEHLMRRRIPVVLISTYTQAQPILRELPLKIVKKLETEFPDKRWSYGTDWVNFGARPGGFLEIQKLAKSKDFHEVLKADASGVPIKELPLMQKVRKIEDIALLGEFTGLVGAFNIWLQYFQNEKYKPVFVHGCTSITIPEAYIFYESKQIVGLLEGIAGAAWYEYLLGEKYRNRSGELAAIPTNTGISYAQLVIIGLIVLGNLPPILRLLLGSKAKKPN